MVLYGRTAQINVAQNLFFTTNFQVYIIQDNCLQKLYTRVESSLNIKILYVYKIVLIEMYNLVCRSTNKRGLITVLIMNIPSQKTQSVISKVSTFCSSRQNVVLIQAQKLTDIQAQALINDKLRLFSNNKNLSALHYQ